MRAWQGARPTATPLTTAALAAAALLSACDFFATREFAPKPAAVAALAGAFAAGDTVSFLVTETLARPGAGSADSTLSSLRIRFYRAADSLQAGDGSTTLAVLVLSEPPGAYRAEGALRMRVGAEGLSLQGSGEGARFFPLKLSADAGTGSGSAGAESGEAGFLALPAVFTAGAAWTQPLGALEAEREVEGVDTLRVGKRLEECWRVAETVRDGTGILSRGRFWYGASGLLRGEQAWTLGRRDADGMDLGAAELRRALVRL